MRRGRPLWIALVASAAAIAVSGCGTLQPRVCAGPAEGPPGIELDATPWLGAHPGESLEACLASRCSVLAQGQETAGLQAPMQNIAGTYTLILRSGGVVVAREQIHLADQTAAGPCGMVHIITIKALTVDADGKLIDTPPHPAPYATASSAP